MARYELGNCLRGYCNGERPILICLCHLKNLGLGGRMRKPRDRCAGFGMI